MSSSEYMTESEDANAFVDAQVAPADADMENVASINQPAEAEAAAEADAAPIVNVESPSPHSQTNAEMQFSPPYMEHDPQAPEGAAFDRDRQNTNIPPMMDGQAIQNHNMRTGTLWFNPQQASAPP